jgi:hypothetical protein
MKRLALAVLLLAACPAATAPRLADAGGGDAEPPDTGPSDAGLPPCNRTLVQRTLMPTSPQNLLRDPLIGGEQRQFGQFRAFFLGGSSLPLTRTFRSVSPVGGAASIEELRDLPTHGGNSKSIRVTSIFAGGAGNCEGKIWLSAGDAGGTPVPFSRASPNLIVVLIDHDGTTQSMLVAGAPQQFGDREWVLYQTQGAVPMPRGGSLMLTLTDFALTLQLAAPEVTSSSKPMLHAMHLRPSSDEDRRALLQAHTLDRH